MAAGVSFVVVGGSRTPLFAMVGAFWLMVLVDFPGNRRRRAPAHCGVGFNGAVLITLGTLVAPMPWLAVTLMFVLKDSTVQAIALRIARSQPLDRPV